MNTIDLSQMPCAHLRGVGAAIFEKLNILGIYTLQDLLFHLPFRYEDRTTLSRIADLKEGSKGLIEGKVQMVEYPLRGKTRFLCELQDATRRIHLRFFQVYPLHKKLIREGVRLRCFGELRFGPTGLEMVHPEWQVVKTGAELLETHLTPVYPTTEGITQYTWRKLMQQALTFLGQEALLQELLPATLTQKHLFPSLREALLFVHRPPKGVATLLLEERKHPTQRRLVFEELLAHRLGLLKLKASLQHYRAVPMAAGTAKTEQFLQSLPYRLTAAQQRVAGEISQDLQRPYPMLRLVQGDVGSGKTVVAALAVLCAIENGYQAALMAPTEILAEQHYHFFKQYFEPLGLHVVLLSGQIKAAARKTILTALKEGRAQLAVGTHALFQKEIHFSKLALLVIDEQHRFGVHQRVLLREKGVHAEQVPHQLIMTATPIPRTLAMSMYADLDYSIIDELPPGRLPIKTKVIPHQRREEVMQHVYQACQQGRQAYWVCPLIDESELLTCQAVEKTAQHLQQLFPHLRLGLIHGRLKPAIKENTMQAFKKQALDVLVATTVIEVGVDVPNASLMIIENAERLGLSQLHQLRGRVGRGATESHCILLYQAPLSEFAARRLAAIRNYQDGFKIAEQDLELRGPGDVLGVRQTGDINFKLAELLRDRDLLPQITTMATELMAAYPDVVAALIERWLGKNQYYRFV